MRHLISSAVVVGFVGLNALGAAIVGKVESYLVYLKLAVLGDHDEGELGRPVHRGVYGRGRGDGGG